VTSERDGWRRLVRSLPVGVTGLALLAVPLFDMWEDVYVGGKPPFSTLMENSVPVGLALSLVAATVWLARREWEPGRVTTVSKWTTGGVVGVGVVFVWVLGIQIVLQGEYKPVIIALDAVVVGGAVAFVVGVSQARADRNRDRVAAERNRLSTLFENTADCIAAVELVDGRPIVREANAAFRSTFVADGERPAVGRPLGEVVRPVTDGGRETAETAETAFAERVTDAEVRRRATDGDRDFLLDLVPAGVGDTALGYAVYTDITEQKRRERQIELMNSMLRHDIQNAMTIVRARGEHLTEALDGREARFAETVVDRSEDVAELVDRFRVMLDSLTGEAETGLRTVDLTAVLAERTDRFRQSYPHASLETEIPDGLAVRADDVLGNIVGNLLSNAVDHNDTDEPSVSVTATERAEWTVVRVADDGPGVPDDLKDAVFRRDETGMTETAVGSGFGLFFVDQMMDRYGGSVRIEDNEPRGAVFVLELRPAGTAEPEA
jgi:signal transduction histidine kinase